MLTICPDLALVDKNVLLDANQKRYDRAIQCLSEGRLSSGLNLEIISGKGLVFSVRLNREARLILGKIKVNGTCYLVPLEVLENHEYDHCFWVNGTIKDIKQRLQPLIEKIENQAGVLQEKDDANFAVVDVDEQNSTPIEIQFYGNELLTLGEMQKLAVESNLPLTVTGLAGSGKTCVASALIERLSTLDNISSTQPVVYIAPTEHLKNHMDRILKQLDIDDLSQKVQCCVYQDFLKECFPEYAIVNDVDLRAWIQTHNKDKHLDVDMLIQEFRIVFAMELDVYLGLGQRDSFFEQDDRNKVHNLCQKYQKYLIANKLIHEQLSLIPEERHFSAVIIDEAQLLGRAAIKRLYDNTIKRQCALFVDPYQSQVALSCVPYCARLTSNMQVLPIVYRCSQKVTALARSTVETLGLILGGRMDNVSSHEVIADQSAVEGEVYCFSTIEPLKESIQSDGLGSRVVVITTPDKIEEAKRLFNTPLVMTVNDIRGLEYDIVILYKPFDLFQQLIKEVMGIYRQKHEKIEADRKQKRRNRVKRNIFQSINPEIVRFFYDVFTQITRARKNIYLIQGRKHPGIDRLLTVLLDQEVSPLISNTTSIDQFSNTSIHDWYDEFIRLVENNRWAIAMSIFIEKIQGNEAQLTEHQQNQLKKALNQSSRDLNNDAISEVPVPESLIDEHCGKLLTGQYATDQYVAQLMRRIGKTRYNALEYLIHQKKEQEKIKQLIRFIIDSQPNPEQLSSILIHLVVKNAKLFRSIGLELYLALKPLIGLVKETYSKDQFSTFLNQENQQKENFSINFCIKGMELKGEAWKLPLNFVNHVMLDDRFSSEEILQHFLRVNSQSLSFVSVFNSLLPTKHDYVSGEDLCNYLLAIKLIIVFFKKLSIHGSINLIKKIFEMPIGNEAFLIKMLSLSVLYHAEKKVLIFNGIFELLTKMLEQDKKTHNDLIRNLIRHYHSRFNLIIFKAFYLPDLENVFYGWIKSLVPKDPDLLLHIFIENRKESESLLEKIRQEYLPNEIIKHQSTDRLLAIAEVAVETFNRVNARVQGENVQAKFGAKSWNEVYFEILSIQMDIPIDMISSNEFTNDKFRAFFDKLLHRKGRILYGLIRMGGFAYFNAILSELSSRDCITSENVKNFFSLINISNLSLISMLAGLPSPIVNPCIRLLSAKIEPDHLNELFGVIENDEDLNKSILSMVNENPFFFFGLIELMQSKLSPEVFVSTLNNLYPLFGSAWIIAARLGCDPKFLIDLMLYCAKYFDARTLMRYMVCASPEIEGPYKNFHLLRFLAQDVNKYLGVIIQFFDILFKQKLANNLVLHRFLLKPLSFKNKIGTLVYLLKEVALNIKDDAMKHAIIERTLNYLEQAADDIELVLFLFNKDIDKNLKIYHLFSNEQHFDKFIYLLKKLFQEAPIEFEREFCEENMFLEHFKSAYNKRFNVEEITQTKMTLFSKFSSSESTPRERMKYLWSLIEDGITRIEQSQEQPAPLSSV